MQGYKRSLIGKTRRMNARETAVLGRFAKQVTTAVWDFSVDGGAVGTISFAPAPLPAGAVVTNVYTDEQTAVTGATSVTLNAGSTALTGAVDFTGDSGVNSRALASSATAIKLAADSDLTITIATNPATAGKVRFCVEWYLSES